MSIEIDKTSFLILRTLEDAERALWKKKIHTRLPDAFEHDVSLQTIGRRVDNLIEAELIESAITSPDEIKRDLIIGYRITTKGEQAIETKRQNMLEGIVQENLFKEEKHADLEEEALVEMVCNHFRFSDNIKTLLHNEYSEHAVIDLLTSRLVDYDTGNVPESLQAQRQQAATDTAQELTAPPYPD